MNNNIKYLYGLDISMKNTGVTIFNLSNLEHVYTTSISTEHLGKKPLHGKKLKHIADEMFKIIEKYPPSIISAERSFSRFNAETATIYRCVGVFNYLFSEFEFTYYPPKTVKEVIIHGTASKQLVQDEIKKKYPEIIFNNDDESDSFAVALTYLIKNNLLAWEKSTLYKKPIKRSKNIKDKQ